MRFVAGSVACLVLWALPRPAAADIYTRTDEHGVVHVTNVPEGPGWTLAIKEERKQDSATGSDLGRRKAKFVPFIEEAARVYAIPAALIMAVIEVESAWRPSVVSHAGAVGLMQLMPGTARALGVKDVFNPRENILGGTRYLRLLANKYAGDIVLTLAAYNAGEGRVTHRMAPPYPVTRDYVEAVLRHYRAYRDR